MSQLRKLMLQDVRCFQNETLDIRPLTFLIGENSTGKSTALGCLQILGNFLTNKKDSVDFNSKSYQMGAFADIARKSNPQRSRFKLGMEFRTDLGKPCTFLLSLRERETGSEPIIDKIRCIFDDGEITVIIKKRSTRSKKKLNDIRKLNAIKKFGKNKYTIVYDYPLHKFSADPTFLGSLFFSLAINDMNGYDKKEEINELMAYLRDKLGGAYQAQLPESIYNIDSLAPIRSKPRRTYDPLKETADPEGNEVPMLLRNLKNKDKDGWGKLYKQLVEFGKASGLFSDIVIRELGRAMNDPFQLQIKANAKSPTVNLVDVGYGVGQLLPILVRIFNANDPTMFLLQQPEAHLHPSVQAQLSTLLVNAHKNPPHSFLVETHSDYIIDRTRILVRNEKIEPQDVSILYFEPMKESSNVKVHNIKMDADGNLTNVPQSYRDFFTKETDTLLGFDEE